MIKKILLNGFISLSLLSCLMQHSMNAAAASGDAIRYDGARKATYRCDDGRYTYLDKDPENVANLGRVRDVLSDADLAYSKKVHETPCKMAMTLIPFLAGVAMPCIVGLMDDCSPRQAIGSVAVVTAAVTIADLRGFVTHLVADHTDVNNKDLPVALRALALFFQDHHLRPTEMKKASYWYVSRVFYQLDLALVLPLTTLATMYGYYLPASVIALSSLVFVQNQAVHNHVHGGNFGSKHFTQCMRFLQRCGLVISNRFHAEHHAAARHDVGYSIVTGHFESACNYLFPRVIPYIESNAEWFLNTTARRGRQVTGLFSSLLKRAFCCRKAVPVGED